MTAGNGGWATARVRDVAIKIGSGRTPNGGSLAYHESGVIFIRSQNVHFGGLRLEDVAYIDMGTHREMRSTEVRPHDALLNITGASLGRVALAPKWLSRANVNQHVCIVRPGPTLDPRFLVYALSGSPVQDEIRSIQVGGNRDGLNFEQVGNLRIPYPALSEQRRIADFLDVETARIDRLAAQYDRMAQLLTARVDAIRDAAVSKLANMHGLLPLRRFLTGIEQGESPQCDAQPRDPGEWGVLKLSAVKAGVFVPTENKRLPPDSHPNRRFEVRDGDLLVTRANTPDLVGDVAVVNGGITRLLLPDLIYRLSLVPSVSPQFVSAVLLSTRTRSMIKADAHGSSQSMVKIRREDIKVWPIPTADAREQDALVREIATAQAPAEAMRRSLNRSRTVLLERKQALITAAVTGQFDVTTARGVDLS